MEYDNVTTIKRSSLVTPLKSTLFGSLEKISLFNTPYSNIAVKRSKQHKDVSPSLKLKTIKKFSRKKEKKLIDSLQRNNCDYREVRKDFPGFSVDELRNKTAQLMRRVLLKVNRENRYVLKSNEIGKIKADYLNKMIKAYLNKKVQKSNQTQIEFLPFLKNYMFLSKDDLSKLYTDPQKKILRFLLLRTVEIYEIEEINNLRMLKMKTDVKNIHDNFTRDFKIEFNKSAEESREDLLVNILNEYEKIKKVYKTIKADKDNVFKKPVAMIHYNTLKFSLGTMERNINFLSGKAFKRGTDCLLAEARRKSVFCVNRLKSATITFKLLNLAGIFSESEEE